MYNISHSLYTPIENAIREQDREVEDFCRLSQKDYRISILSESCETGTYCISRTSSYWQSIQDSFGQELPTRIYIHSLSSESCLVNFESRRRINWCRSTGRMKIKRITQFYPNHIKQICYFFCFIFKVVTTRSGIQDMLLDNLGV